MGLAGNYGTDWQRLEGIARARYGDTGLHRVSEWQALLAALNNQPVEIKLTMVNDFFNQKTQWTTDSALFGQPDYWASPLETLALKAGDCEDFTIAKYITLLSSGIDARSLRLVYVKANRPGLAPQAHMVLAWYSAAQVDPLILDNINPNVVRASERGDLTPIFSFNHKDLWLGAGNRDVRANPQQRMARWQRVLEKIRAEGMAIE